MKLSTKMIAELNLIITPSCFVILLNNNIKNLEKKAYMLS